MSPAPDGKSVAVIGGGLAGLSASSALADAGFKVTIFERRPYLGGRASSYEHPGTSEVVDNCQHVLLGCCTNLLDFYRRLGVEEKIRWFSELNFIEPGGRQSLIRSSFLPAPFHNGPSFLRVKFLDAADKDAIARGLLRLAGHLPSDNGKENFLEWLERVGQTERAIERFWKPVLVSALNEDLERMSVRYAAQVFRESFLKSNSAGRLGIPQVPLTDLYSAAGGYVTDRGGEVFLRSSVDAIQSAAKDESVTINAAGKQLRFDYAIAAVAFDGLSRILPEAAELAELREKLTHFESSPITGIHLWLDRQITDLEHAVLLDRTIQWMFHKSKLIAARAEAATDSCYIELVISSSKSLVNKSRQEILDLAMAELKEFFPAAAEAQLVKGAVIKEVNATYSALPGTDRYRPSVRTAWPRLFLAGDWTATGWPATMEGAVRSGYAAAEALVQASDPGRKLKFLVPDLPASGFMRMWG